MHALNCNCPECRMARELEMGQWEFMNLGEMYGEMGLESPFGEVEEIELAAELLSVSNEAELDQFLGKLFKGIGRGLKKVGRFIGKRVLPTLGKGLKAIGKVALPVVGKALGSFIPIPGVGTAIGGALGTAVSNALEMEFGELSPEEQEFEIARRFVRIAGTAAQQAAMAPPDSDPQEVVRRALITATRRHVGFLPGFADGGKSISGGDFGSARSGRWVRRGRDIVLLGR